MKTKIIKAEFKKYINETFYKRDDLMVLRELENEIKIYLDLGYIPIRSPQKYDDGWFLIMYSK